MALPLGHKSLYNVIIGSSLPTVCLPALIYWTLWAHLIGTFGLLNESETAVLGNELKKNKNTQNSWML